VAVDVAFEVGGELGVTRLPPDILTARKRRFGKPTSISKPPSAPIRQQRDSRTRTNVSEIQTQVGLYLYTRLAFKEIRSSPRWEGSWKDTGKSGTLTLYKRGRSIVSGVDPQIVYADVEAARERMVGLATIPDCLLTVGLTH
jgi:hypothetical protein